MVAQTREYVLIDPAKLDDEPAPKILESGVPSLIRAFVVVNEPKMNVYPNFLTKAEARSLISLGGDNWSATAHCAPFDPSSPPERWSCASSQCCRILKNSQDYTVTSIEHRVATISGIPLSNLERMNLCRFEPGVCLEDVQESRFRSKTVIVFLNEMQEGDGELDFPELAYRFRPRVGSALMFNNTNEYEQEDVRILHNFTAPQHGTLFCLRCYFAETPVRSVGATPGCPPPKPFVTIDPQFVLDKYGSGRYKDEVGQEVVKMFLVHKDPQIFVVPCFVEDDEIQHLIDLAEKAWVPSSVGRGVYKTGKAEDDLKNTQSNNRTSYSCMLRSSETAQVLHVERRLAALAGLDIKYLERLNMVRYYPGQYFNEHHDGNFRPKTVFVYLNDLEDEEGGETMFTNLGVQIKPRKGCAVMWSNLGPDGKEDMRMVHRGVAPLSGAKYGVNCFFNDRPIRELEANVQQVDVTHGTDR